MNFKLSIAALILIPFALTACSKQESAPAAQQGSASEVVVDESSQITPEQQAAIDAIDQPEQDKNNTDIPSEVANAPADQATADAEVAASTAQ